MSNNIGINEYHKFLKRESIQDSPIMQRVWIAAWNKAWDTACEETNTITRRILLESEA